jgi:hypothetical protein
VYQSTHEVIGRWNRKKEINGPEWDLATETRPLLPIWPDGGEYLGLGKSQTYAAVNRRELPTLMLNGRERIVTEKLRAMLGIRRVSTTGAGTGISGTCTARHKVVSYHARFFARIAGPITHSHFSRSASGSTRSSTATRPRNA